MRPTPRPTTAGALAGPRLLGLILGLLLAAGGEPAAASPAGTIRLELGEGARIVRAWAVRRVARTLTTQSGEEKDIGLEATRHAGRVEAEAVHFEALPVPGRYDLRLETASGGILQGWDASVPPSDYVGDPPLEASAIRKILAKQRDEQFSAFYDRVRVLEVRGNIQHAALLVEGLRRRPFTGGGYRPGEWVWRVDRFQWEHVLERNWAPFRQRPFYALVRRRLDAEAYRSIAIAYAAHLGGLALTEARPERALGPFELPEVKRGVIAVDTGGEPIKARTIKGESP